jgi:hypothetical protein
LKIFARKISGQFAPESGGQFSRFAQSIAEVQKLTASDRGANEYFGFSVDISGEFAISGAPNEGTLTSRGKSNEGASYIYQRKAGGQWQEIQKLVANERGPADYFGKSVAISGKYAFVGASGHEYDEKGTNKIRFAGSVYVFERNQDGKWIQIQKLVAPNRISAEFGSSISVHQNFLIIGAPSEKTGETAQMPGVMSGSVYIFKQDAQGKWQFEQNIIASDKKPDAYFGYCHSIQGNMLAVGAYWEKSDASDKNPLKCAGAVYIYKRNARGIWIESQKIVASDRSAADFFGWDVHMDGKTLAVGAYRKFIGEESMHGATYMFRLQKDSTWVEVQKLQASDHGELDCFGSQVALSGNIAIVSASGDYEDVSGKNKLSEAGSAYLFKQDECGKWKEIQKFTAKNRGYSSNFGYAMAIDGNNVVIGAMHEELDAFQKNKLNEGGAIHIFSISGMGTNPCNDSVISIIPSDEVNLENATIDTGVSIAIKDCKIILSAIENNARYQLVRCNQENKNIEGAIFREFMPDENGRYAVVITKNGKKFTSDCYDISIVETAEAEENDFKISPNPNSGIINIETTGKITNPIPVEIVSPLGRVIYQSSIKSALTPIDIGKLKTGIYIIKFDTKDGVKKISLFVE